MSIHGRSGGQDQGVGRISARRQWQFGGTRHLPAIVALLGLLALLAVAPARASPQRVSLGSYFGGASDDSIRAVARDNSGIYLTGKTYSANLPGTSGPLNGSNDMFVAKLSPDGTRLLWSLRLGGSRSEEGRALVSDGQSVFVTGSSDSPDFPTTPGVEQTSFGGFEDIVLLRLDAASGAVRWATYFGEDNLDQGNAIALDGRGGVLVAGWWAQNDAVVLKFDAATGVGQWGTAWSGRSEARANALALDAQGNIWVTGVTDTSGSSSDFEVVGPALQTSCGTGSVHGGCGPDAFVTQLSADGQQIRYSSFLGGSHNGSETGSGRDEGTAIAVDGQGNILVAGKTLATDFPTRNALQATKAGADNFSDAFLTKITPDGSTILYSTYLGGAAWDEARALVLDEQGNATLAGFTASPEFPTKDAAQPALGNGVCEIGGVERFCYDAFIAQVSPTGALSWSTFLGGGLDELGYGLARDGDAVLVAGTTESYIHQGFPISPGAFQEQKGFGGEGFLIRLGGGGGGGGETPPPGQHRVYVPLLRR